MLDKLRKRVKDHINRFGYKISSEEEDEIVTLYELNHDEYDKNLISLHIENCINRLLAESENKESKWSLSRRNSVFAKKVSTEDLDVPNFEKDTKLFEFLISRLGSNIPFCLLSESQKKTLVGSMYPLIIEKGTTLIKEGDLGAEMYIVEDGEFDVLVKGEITNRLSSGSVFGELALLHGIPRTATVIATTRSKVWSAEQTSFSCIRIRDQIYRRNVAKNVLKTNPYFTQFNLSSDNIETLINMAKSKFIEMNSEIKLEDKEIIIALKQFKIKDNEVRIVQPNELIFHDFFSLSDADCIIINLKNA